MVERVTGKLCIVIQGEFLQHPRAIGADRVHTQGKFVPYLRDGLARAQHLQDLELPVGKVFVRCFLHVTSKVCEFLSQRKNGIVVFID